MKNIGFLIVFTLLGASSCTIQKRVHLPGYHMEWHQKKKPQKKQNQTVQEQEEQTSNAFEQPMVIALNDSIKAAATKATESHDLTTKAKKSLDVVDFEDRSQEMVVLQRDESPLIVAERKQAADSLDVWAETPPDTREFNTWGLVGFSILVLPYIYSYALFALPIGLIFSIIGLVQTNRQPWRFKGKKLYIFGIVTAMLMIFGTLLLWSLVARFLF